MRAQAERFAQQRRDTATREDERRIEMQLGVRGELARLYQILGAELTFSFVYAPKESS